MTTAPDGDDRGKTIREQIGIISLAEGFFSSSILFALHRLGVFEHLESGARTSGQLADDLGCSSGTLERLLNAAVLLKLLQVREDTYELAGISRRVLLKSAGDGYIGYWIELMEQFSQAYSRLDEAVMSSSPALDPVDYLGGDAARTRQYVLAMHTYAAMRGKDLARHLSTAGSASLLDLGCGPGTFAFHLAMENPELRITLADVPGVLEVARDIRTRYPVVHEVSYVPMDASCDAIPGTYDIVLASNFLQCFNEQDRTALLGRIYQAVNPGGSIVVQAQHLQADRVGVRWAVLVDLNLLCTTKEGRNHTVAETVQWLTDAGFVRLEHNPMSALGTMSYVRGYRPL